MLNQNYYETLLDKYSISQDCNKLNYLTSAIILDNYRDKNIYFNFPQGYDLQGVVNLLYENLSKQIFINYADLTDYSIGDKLKRKREKGKNIYIIKEIVGSNYILVKEKDENNTIIPGITFDNLKRNYIRVKQSTRNDTLLKYNDFFEKNNEYGFLPTHFTKKLVLIAGQTIWNGLENRGCIPSIYLPNTREGEQTSINSIPALEDCIVYVTPKYEVCYEEILKKDIMIDTLVLCNADLNCLSQVMLDQQKYNFKIIALSDTCEIPKLNNISFWDWQKEEVNLIEQKSKNKIEIIKIKDNKLVTLFQKFEETQKYVSALETPIKLTNYGYYLRMAFNALQEDSYDYVLYRLQKNKELEQNEGGYDIDYFGENNPKVALKELIQYLKDTELKINKIKHVWEESNKKLVIIADRNDMDFLKELLKTTKNIFSNSELNRRLKSKTLKNKTLLFYSFDGTKREFDFINSLSNNIKLVLYEQENILYINQLNNYKANIEKEITSENRFELCKIKYEPIFEPPVIISPTLKETIQKLDERSQKAYESYKDESDSLLDDGEERGIFQIELSNGEIVELDNKETVFDREGDLIYTYKLKEGNEIRIYPKQLAENLFQIAVEVEPDIFKEIDKHSKYWQEILKKLDDIFPQREFLYKELKKHGLKVLPATVDAYFIGKRKFPMYNSDLHAIFDLADEVIPGENFATEILPKIKKSKRLYNSTMIALGRGVKQELKQFLKNRSIGEILQKKNFTGDTLQRFINEYMPLLTIIKIKEIADE